MLRTFVCTALALIVFATVGLADEAGKKKKRKNALAGTTGEIVRVDAEKGTLTVKVQIK